MNRARRNLALKKTAVGTKIEKIKSEGIRGRKVSQRQAVAVALSMQRRGQLRKKAIKNYKTVVDKKLPHYGESDLEKKVLKVNPKKGEVVNTMIHEKLHMAHPKMSEKEARKMSDKMEREMSIKKQAEMMKKLSKAKVHKKVDGKAAHRAKLNKAAERMFNANISK